MLGTRRTLIGWLGLIASAACSSAEPAPGRLIVVVTTDLAIPVDIDSLYWRVLVDDTEIDGGPFPLSTGAELPATLAIVAGSDEHRETEVRLWGYKGMQPRVQREARITVPRRGVRLAGISLDWACSDAHPIANCSPGSTCQAGDCIDVHVVSPLLSLPTAEPCFDVIDCFAAPSLLDVPPPGPDGECSLALPPSSDGSNLNVGLVVNTAVAGNFGHCRPLGDCLIALDRDSPSGWRLFEQRIVLPRSVCGELRPQVAQLALATRCRSKTHNAATCQALDTCARFEGDLCAVDWPLGFSCTGNVTPFGLQPDAMACREVKPDGESVGAHYCCTND